MIRVQPVTDYSAERTINSFVQEMIGEKFQEMEWDRAGSCQPKRIVIKPNWLQESHDNYPDEWISVITHPTIIIAVINQLAALMKGEGSISVCDSPHTYADFNRIVNIGSFLAEIEIIKRTWPKLQLNIMDLRHEIWVVKDGVIFERRPSEPDPCGYVKFNLGIDSLFFGFRGEGRYYGADYDAGEVNMHHVGTLHEYLLAGTAVASDLIVNLPKIKTHKKTGITCCLKNLVGVTGNKNWLPHHTCGNPTNGGDEFQHASLKNYLDAHLRKIMQTASLTLPQVGPWIFSKLRPVGLGIFSSSGKVVRNGNWYGNDTCWRMVLDLVRAVLYGRPDGSFREATQRKPFLNIVDAIVGGQGDGPTCPDPAKSQCLIAGQDLAAVDAVACKLMGYDPTDVALVWGAFQKHRWPIAETSLEEIRVEDRRSQKVLNYNEVNPAVPGGFIPHFAWKNLQKIATH